MTTLHRQDEIETPSLFTSQPKYIPNTTHLEQLRPPSVFCLSIVLF
jgi:hypothetical protein